MVRIIDIKREDCKKKSKIETLLHFIETEIEKPESSLVARANKIFGDLIDIDIIDVKGWFNSKKVMTINFNNLIGDTKISYIQLYRENFLETATNLAEKYESLFKDTEVKIYQQY